MPLTLGIALGQALLINAIRRGSNLFRLLLFLPVVTAEAAVGSHRGAGSTTRGTGWSTA